MCQSRSLGTAQLDNDENVTFEDDKDELDLYLEQGVTHNHRDTFGWWKVRSVDFPNVA